MNVSLVVPMRNEVDSIEELVRTIREQTRPPDEVILVDGGSTDGTIGVATSLIKDDRTFRIVEAGDATPGRGRNVGIAAAAHEWIALTDAGIQLEPNWLEELVSIARQDASCDVVYGNYEPIAHSWFTQCAVLAYVHPRQERGGGTMRGPVIPSSLLHRRVWEAVEGFPDLRAAEDHIFMRRVEEGGFQIGWAPGATVHWQIAPSLARTFRRFALYSKHNVWAGQQRYWHYGVARLYAAAIPILALAVFHNPWWLLLLLFAFAARTLRAIWRRRDGRSAFWICNPLRLATVGLILLTIDAATFAGWIAARVQRAPKPLAGYGATEAVASSRLSSQGINETDDAAA